MGAIPPKRRDFVGVMRDMKGLPNSTRATNEPADPFLKKAGAVRSFPVMLDVGGKGAGVRQRQTCEPGSHLGSRVRTRCNLVATVPILRFDLNN